MSNGAGQGKDQQADKQKASSKAGWVVVVFMLAVIGGLIAWNPEFVTDLFSGKDDAPKMEVIQAGETTGMGFLNVEGTGGVVYLDAEKVGRLPVKNKVIRSGRHRLVIKDQRGAVLLDKTLDVKPGATETVQLKPAGAGGPGAEGADG